MADFEMERTAGGLKVRRHGARARADKGAIRETVESLAVAFLIFVVVRTLAFQAFQIPSSSMEPTLLPGDFLFVNKFFYGAKIPWTSVRLPGFTHPKPGDIIVFQYPEDPKTDFIKRCVAIGGQTVEMRHKQLYIDGVPQTERFTQHIDPYVNPRRDDFGPIRVPAGELFMMGDNRDNSHDSRFWGTVRMDQVRGKAWVTYFSVEWDNNAEWWRKPFTVRGVRIPRMFRWIH